MHSRDAQCSTKESRLVNTCRKFKSYFYGIIDSYWLPFLIFMPRAKQLIEQKRIEKEDDENQVPRVKE